MPEIFLYKNDLMGTGSAIPNLTCADVLRWYKNSFIIREFKLIQLIVDHQLLEFTFKIFSTCLFFCLGMD